MFLKGFICGVIGMAAIAVLLIWGMTPRATDGAVDLGYGDTVGFIQRDC